MKRWLRQFVEVRDAEGAERCILSALQAGADEKIMADMLFATATDHRYIDTGHPLDFTNKAFEALDAVGWQAADVVLSSLVKRYAHANRMEESNAWRHPVDLIDVLNTAFDMLPAAVERGQSQEVKWADRDQLLNVLIADDPREIAVALLHALEEGSTFDQLAGTVSYAAALRIARFHTSNEFNDWDTALHTFTFANAVQQGFRRIGHEPGSDRYPLLLRGVFDAAMSVYQDRFLNIPPARLPDPAAQREDPGTLIERFDALLDRQQQVDPAGKLTAAYLDNEGDPDQLLSRLGRLLLREDRDFHTIQTVEAAFRQYETFRGTPAGLHVLVAAARYLAAHSPTVRARKDKRMRSPAGSPAVICSTRGRPKQSEIGGVLTSGSLQNQDSDFWRTVYAQREPCGSNPTIGVVDHAIKVIAPDRVSSCELGKDRRPEPRKNHLPAMRVAGNLKVEPPRRSTDIREIRLMDEQHRRALRRKTLQDEIQAISPLLIAVYARKVKSRLAAPDRMHGVVEVHDLAVGNNFRHKHRICPMVVVAHDGQNAVRRR